MKQKKERLIEVLQELELLLAKNESTIWHDWMTQSRDLLVNSDYSGIELLLSAYGGMGSFNDLILDKPAADNQLMTLRTKAWDLADTIRREQQLE